MAQLARRVPALYIVCSLKSTHEAFLSLFSEHLLLRCGRFSSQLQLLRACACILKSHLVTCTPSSSHIQPVASGQTETRVPVGSLEPTLFSFENVSPQGAVASGMNQMCSVRGLSMDGVCVLCMCAADVCYLNSV